MSASLSLRMRVASGNNRLPACANSIKEVVTSPWFLLIIGLIVLLVLVYIVLAVIYNRKKKNLRKVKKYKDL